ALFTRPSTRAVASRIAATVVRTCSSSRMSQERVRARPPARSISSLTSSSLASRRPTSATVAPRLASSCAVQRPMPLPPPVTMWVSPANMPGRKIESNFIELISLAGSGNVKGWRTLLEARMRFGLTTPVVTLAAGSHADWEIGAGPAEIGRIAVAADRLGFHHLTCSEHVGIPREVVPVRGGRYYDPLAT